MPSVDDVNYIAFGIWLDEDAPTANSRLHGYTFGAYHGGGTQLTSGVAEVTGKATYTGPRRASGRSETETETASTSSPPALP